ncbi:MAG: S-methyl-5-thioribose-1-phosphate isomerase [Myxococcales bacterium]|nr:S-methyl-5-thioribose-1-phosphate isomerase [Myxococcales bacterium]
MHPAQTTIAAVRWRELGPTVELIDQRQLPGELVLLRCTEPAQVIDAIRTLAVRGAPAIGVAAAYGIALGLCATGDIDRHVDALCDDFAATRPTAVNLFWAVAQMRDSVAHSAGLPTAQRHRRIVAAAHAIAVDDASCCAAMGRHGAALLPDRGGILTHCNTGSLATAGIGTALGVIRTAIADGKQLHVWIDETRPLLQGARLTAWECAQDGIAATLICDNMAGHALKTGRIAAAIVGADRIAANGDSANKIGTYPLAVLCAHHGVPLYIAAPTSTIDLQCPHGDAIPIEERAAQEVTHPLGVRFAADGVGVFNPAFDVAPASLIAAIITEEGVARPPFAVDLQAMVDRARLRRSAATAGAQAPQL